MSSFVEIFRDEFDDSSLALPTDLGNGSFAETSFLRATCPVSVNCEWWFSTHNAPVAYTTLPALPAQRRCYRAEHRLFAFAASGNNIFPGLVVWQDRNNAYLMGYDNTSSNVAVNVTVGGSSGTVQNTTGLSSPNTTAHRYRVYWNRSGHSVELPEADAYELTNNRITWYRSVDDGATYTRVYDRDIDFDIQRVGVYGYTYGALPSLTADFDYLAISAVTVDEDITDKAGVEDEVTILPNVVGPKQYQSGLPAGARIPGPAEQPTTSVGPFDVSGVEDQETVQDVGGDLNQQEVGAGYVLGVDSKEKRPHPVAGVEDTEDRFLSTVPDFTTATSDVQGHPHFIATPVKNAFYYNASNDPWNSPTDPSFSGYGRDGVLYLNGVSQGTQAPWALEVASNDRSSRNDFPIHSLFVITRQELVIFDLDTYPTDLTVWMRFRLGADLSNYYLLGRFDDSIIDVRMVNGVMVVGLNFNGTDVGRLVIADFKRDGIDQDWGHLIGSDNHWHITAGWDLQDRNTNGIWTTSGVSPSLRINNEHVVSVAAYQSGTKFWVAAAGEDASPNVIEVDVATGIPQYDYDPVGPNLGGDQEFWNRWVEIDHSGWLWFTNGDRLYRNLTDYQSGSILLDAGSLEQRSVQFPEDITRGILVMRNLVYVGTDKGIYQVDKGTMQAHLAYTISGAGGRGKDDLAPPAGELLTSADDDDFRGVRQFSGLKGFNETIASYLTIAMQAARSGPLLLRTYDDFVPSAFKLEYPTLDETTAYFNQTYRA